MEETIEFTKNDTVRAIETQIQHLKKWANESPKAKQKEVEQVITKLKGAMFWALNMVDRSE